MNFEELMKRMPKTADEISLGLYINYAKQLEHIKPDEYDTIMGQLKLFSVVATILGVAEEDMDEISLDDTEKLCTGVSELITKAKDFKPSDHFTIDGTTYATRQLKDMNSLTHGEYVSISTLRDQYKNDNWGLIPFALAILIRPAKLVKDDETGIERWVQDKFSSRDIENLDHRAKLFLEKALAKDLIPVLNFFMNGKEELV